MAARLKIERRGDEILIVQIGPVASEELIKM
jgi:hypothetical protein